MTVIDDIPLELFREADLIGYDLRTLEPFSNVYRLLPLFKSYESTEKPLVEDGTTISDSEVCNEREERREALVNTFVENCEEMNLHCNQLDSLLGLPANLLSLIDLNLSSNNFISVEIPELSFLPSLKNLDLSGNKIKSLMNMPYLPSLRSLVVAHNSISSIEGVEHSVSALEVLDLRDNDISSKVDIMPISYLKNINKLFINKNFWAKEVSEVIGLFDDCPSLETIDDNDRVGWEETVKLFSAVQTPRFDRMAQVFRVRNKAVKMEGNSVVKDTSQYANDELQRFESGDGLEKQNSSVEKGFNPWVPHNNEAPSVVPFTFTMDDDHPKEYATVEGNDERYNESKSSGHASLNISNVKDIESLDHHEEKEIYNIEDQKMRGVEQELITKPLVKKSTIDSRHYCLLVKVLQIVLSANNKNRLLSAFIRWQVFSKKSFDTENTTKKLEDLDMKIKEESITIVKNNSFFEKRLLQEKRKFENVNRKFINNEMVLAEMRRKNELESEKMAKQLTDMQLKNEDLENTLRRIQSEKESLEEKLEEKVLVANELKVELEETFSRMKESDSSTCELQQKMVEMSTEVDYHRELLQSKDNKITEINTLLSSLRSTFDESKSGYIDEIEKLSSKCIVFEENIAELMEKLHIARQETEEKDMARDELQRSIDAKMDDAQKKREEEIQNLQNQIDAYQAKEDLQVQVRSKMEDKIENLQSEKIKLANENKDFRTYMDKDRVTIRELNICVKQLQGIIQRRQSCQKCESYNKEIAILRNNLKETLEAKDEIEFLYNNITLNMSRDKATEETIDVLEQNVKTLEMKETSLLTALRVKETMLDDQSNELLGLKSRLNDYEKDLDTLESTVAAQESLLIDTKNELSLAEDKLSIKNYALDQIKNIIVLLKEHEGELYDILFRDVDKNFFRYLTLDDSDDGNENEKLSNYESIILSMSIDTDSLAKLLHERKQRLEETFYDRSTDPPTYLGCVKSLCKSRINELMNGVAAERNRLVEVNKIYEENIKKKSEECSKIAEALSVLEANSVELATNMASEKEKYNTNVQKLQEDKKILGKICHKFETELLAKEDELCKTKEASEKLQSAIQTFQSSTLFRKKSKK